MIPNINLENGRKLNTEEKSQLFEKITTNPDYVSVYEQIQKYTEIDNEKSEFLAAHKMEFTFEGDTRFIVYAVLGFNENSLISYQRSSGEDGRDMVDIIGLVKTTDDEEEKLITITTSNGSPKFFESTYKGQIEKDFSEGLPDNNEYSEGQSFNGVSPQAWQEFCYPGYNHCGADCGDNGSSGGGAPVDSYDYCCRSHDRCWATFGRNDCDCDCNLKDCAVRNFVDAPPALHLSLMAIFPMDSGCTC